MRAPPHTFLPPTAGALFTGGAAAFFSGSALSTYGATAKLIFDESVAAAAAGEAWP